MEGSLESLSGAAEKVSTAIELLGVGELVSRFSEFAKGALEAGADLAEMAERTGVSVEELQGLSYAAKQSGVSTETLEKGIRKLQQTITSAAQGSAKAQATLKALGVSARMPTATSLMQVTQSSRSRTGCPRWPMGRLKPGSRYKPLAVAARR